MLVSVIAKCKCDVCGKTFEVALDPAYTAPQGWSLYEVVEDKVRGAWTSAVRDGQWLCSECEIKDREAGGVESSKAPEHPRRCSTCRSLVGCERARGGGPEGFPCWIEATDTKEKR